MKQSDNLEPHVFDMKIPLTWLLSSAAAVLFTLGATLWNIAGQSSKLDQLILNGGKLEKRLDDRDTRIDGLRDKINVIERVDDNLTLRIEAIERTRSK